MNRDNPTSLIAFRVNSRAKIMKPLIIRCTYCLKLLFASRFKWINNINSKVSLNFFFIGIGCKQIDILPDGKRLSLPMDNRNTRGVVSV